MQTYEEARQAARPHTSFPKLGAKLLAVGGTRVVWHLGSGTFTLSVGLRLPVEDKDRLAELLSEPLPMGSSCDLPAGRTPTTKEGRHVAFCKS